MPVLGVAVSEQDMDELFSIFDPDGSGLIDYSELHELLQPRSADLDPLKLAFNPWVARQVGRTASRSHRATRHALPAPPTPASRPKLTAIPTPTTPSSGRQSSPLHMPPR